MLYASTNGELAFALLTDDSDDQRPDPASTSDNLFRVS